MHRKGKAFLTVALLIIFGILLLSTRIVTSQNGGTYGPTGYNVLGATSNVSGALTNVQSDNGVYMSFRSYHSGTDTSDFANRDTSDVDSSADKGTHINFSAQQAGPDSIYDTLTEENTANVSSMTLIDNESFEDTWPPTGWTETGAWNKESNQAYEGTYSADFDGPLFGTSSGDLDTPDLDCSDAIAVYVSFWYRDDDLAADNFFLQYYDGSNWDTIADLGYATQENQWLYYQQKITDSQYFAPTFKVRWSGVSVGVGQHIYFDVVTVEKEVGTYNYELDLEVQWANADYDETDEELAIYVNRGNNTRSLDATGGHMIIGGNPDWGSAAGTISFWIKMDISVQGRFWGQDGNMETRWSGTNLVLDWGGIQSMTSAHSFSAGKWYFVAIVWDENNNNLFLYVGDENNPPTLDENSLSGIWTSTTPSSTENRFMNGLGANEPVDGHGDDLRYWNIARSLTEIQSDYNKELTGSEPNLRSCFRLNDDFDDIGPDNNDGSGSGSYFFSSDVPFEKPPTENIRVDVWNGTSWQNLFTDLTDGWNNVSVSSYLESSTFTTRFEGGTETDDATQDRWKIDVMVLHVWSNEYTMEVEFTGSSDTEKWAQLEYSVDSAWTVGSVVVTLQLYNYSLGDYPTNGNGYTSYISSATANRDETKNQTITVNPTYFRNSTGYWKVKVKGFKTADTPFDFKVDSINYEITYVRAHAPFGWVTTILYALPAVVFGLVFLLTAKFKRKKKTDAFSESYGMTHQQMIGEKMLLEIDPTSHYHKTLFDFVSEARDSGERLFIFTSINSALHSAFSGAENVKFFVLTSKTSSPQQINDKATLMPAHDLSVLLNASVEVSKIEKEKTINMLFENLSDTIIRCGFEKTYSFMRLVLEAISSPKVTALFVFNPTAHDSMISSSIRGLFQNQMAYTKSGPKVGTL